MTTTNNNNYSVKDLVAKYRNFVIENAPKETGRVAEELKAEDGLSVPQSDLDWFPDYQLIITLYNTVAGEDADKQVQQVLSKYADRYYKNALTTEELDFLCENFSDTIDELLEEGLFLWNGDKCHYKQLFSRPKRLELLKKRFLPQQGSTIYICDSGCDIAELYHNCNVVGKMYGVFYDESTVDWVLGRIWLYSKKIVSQLSIYSVDADLEETWPISSLSTSQQLDYVVYGTTKKRILLSVVEELYNKLSPNGKMFVFTSYEDMAKHHEKMKLFRQRLVTDKTIASIISFKESSMVHHILLVVEKCQHENVEITSDYSDKRIVIPSESLDADILWPGYYIASKPKDGVSLSTLAHGEKLKNDNEFWRGYVNHDMFEEWEKMQENLPNMRIVLPTNLSSEYKDANLCNQQLNRAGKYEKKTCYFFDNKEPCILLGISNFEKKTWAGYISNIPTEGICSVAPFSCLVPHQGIDVRYLCALLLSSSVSEQIHLVCDGSNNVLSLVLDKIIVPNHDEKERLQFLLEANYEALLSSQKELKEEQENYKKAVRMRKHALTQSLSSIQASFNALNSFRKRNHGVLNDDDCISRIRKTTVGGVFDSVSQKLKDIMPVMEHIADVKYDFGSSEWIDPEDFLDDYIARNENSWLNFKPMKDWAHGQNKYKKDIVDSKTGKTLKKEGESIHKLFFTKKALEIVLDNIVSNAKSHGFTDKERKNYLLKFSWEIVDFNLEIRVENNGTPIPSDRNTASLMEYGVSTALHQNGHNGIGCSDIDDIMQRYEGKVQLVSTPEEEFTVKYLLSFQTNFM